jgi:hypothetical protein
MCKPMGKSIKGIFGILENKCCGIKFNKFWYHSG